MPTGEREALGSTNLIVLRRRHGESLDAQLTTDPEHRSEPGSQG